jgi:hypothetical protein
VGYVLLGKKGGNWVVLGKYRDLGSCEEDRKRVGGPETFCVPAGDSRLAERDELRMGHTEWVSRERMKEITIRIPTFLYEKIVARSKKLDVPIDGDDGIITVALEEHFRRLGE